MTIPLVKLVLQLRSVSRQRLFCAATLCSCIVWYAIFVKRFFPDQNGLIGGDYRYFLPLLLSGKYVSEVNGFLSAPTFTPSFCGGLPLLANPQSIYFSIPQVLAELTDPMLSFYITTVLFAGVGAVSTYFLLRNRFALSCEAASVGGILFLFNGFVLHRMLVGHVPYHAIALTPLGCGLLLERSSSLTRNDRYSSLRLSTRILGIGVIVAYFVYAGALNMVIPLALAILLVWLVHAIFRLPSYSSICVGGLGLFVAGMLSAAKLVSAFVYVQGFPRPGQLLLFDTPFGLLSNLVVGLFFPFLLKDWVVLGGGGHLGRHEGEFGVGVLPIVFGIAAAILVIRRRQITVLITRLTGMWLYWIPLLIICSIPLVVNFGGFGFGVLLKKVPYINNNVTLIRWFWIYILALCVVTGILFDYVVRSGLLRVLWLGVSALGTVVIATATDHSYYFRYNYDPSAITLANAALDDEKVPPQIVGVGPGRNRFDNDGLVIGYSAYPCYEPLFGYYLETFPPGLERGLIGPRGTSSLRNPACYIYGAANGCSPGDLFSSTDAEQAALFAHYRSFHYIRPVWQKIADLLSLLTLLLVLLFPVYAIARTAARRSI